MLDLPRYLLGTVEILLLAGFATLAGTTIRARLLPALSGAPAHLATAVLALAVLILIAELLGSFGLFEPVPYLVIVVGVGSGLWALKRAVGCPSGAAASCFSHRSLNERVGAGGEKPSKTEGHPAALPALVAMAIAALALVKFGLDVKPKLSTGMTGFDSTWYHAPFAAGFWQSGSTWDLHFIAPQFLAWFYPANAELFHGAGMLAFDRDLLSPLLNLGWLAGCLVACWCIGRPYGVAPWSLALGAIALSLPLFSDQAGEARNDIVGTFFLLAAVAIALNGSVRTKGRIPTISANAALVVGLAAGLAAGTKLNFLLPAAVVVLGLAFVAPPGARWRSLATGGVAALVGGGYWYLRNLAHSGNPLPWFDSLGPISLPAPDQALGGREGHSVLGYLTDGAVWSDWLLPGLRDGLTILWPLLLALALASMVLAIAAALPRRGGDRILALAGAVALATASAWLAAPTSASGPDGIPRGFESGLRYLAPAVVLGLTLVPVVLPQGLRVAGMGRPSSGRILKVPASLGRHLSERGVPHTRALVLGALLIVAVAIGYPVQRHYLESRYENPSFAAPGLNAAFAWATPIAEARIATTSTRQYPLFGTELSNHVQFVGEEQPHGGLTAPTTCRRWRELLNEGDYDYVVTSRDRVEPGKPTYPPTTTWTEGAGASVVLRESPTTVFQLRRRLDPSACRR